MNRHSHPTDPGSLEDGQRRRRLLILGSITGLILLALVGVGIYGLLRGPATVPTLSERDTSQTTRTQRLPPAVLPETGNAEPFAEAIAMGLFRWDAGTDHGPAEYMQPLIDIAHESETVALAADLRSYFPDEPVWGELRQMQARQWLTIEQISVPDGWATAVAQAQPGQLPAGTVAYTIDGIRHRTGTWGTEPAALEHPVAFTVFLVCPPGEDCRLLRLSTIDSPLR